ncbi:metalloregulator ArsR/SmtB family transcription factor [Aquipuribacter nitratireducens]|uniref:ArsR/SmtB family transcription factor n=1 Tax=Aquipuribacter nitratireducens TaxID=650104 RepID=A0ABW0GK68_9MICO
MTQGGTTPAARDETDAPLGHRGVLERYESVSELFRALSSPVRVALVTLLTDREMCVHELVDALGLPQPLVSQHLRILRDADLVHRTRRGREVAYVLTDDHVAHIVADARQHSGETADGVDEPVEEHEDAVRVCSP